MKNAPFRADHVGSLLRSDEVKEARAQRGRNEISAEGLRGIENSAIEQLIARQELIGLRAITDGEARRENWALDFLGGLGGTEIAVREVLAPAGGKTAGDKPHVTRIATVVGKLEFNPAHPLLEHFKFLKAHTRAAAKMTIPSPTMIISASRNWREVIDSKAYPHIEDFHRDLAEAYRQAIRAFYDAGCRYLQLDDVNFAYLCDAAMRERLKSRGDDPDLTLRTWIGILSTAIAGRPADMTITTHICRGNFRSSWFAQGGYEAIADAIFNELDYDGYFLEYDSERAGGFEPLRFLPKGSKKVVLGLVTTKSGALENKTAVKSRIEAAAKYADLNQLCLSPQCGFASTEEGNMLTEEEQWAKLSEVAEIAKEVWSDA